MNPIAKYQYLMLFAASFVAAWLLRAITGDVWEHPSRPGLDVASMFGGALAAFAIPALLLRRKKGRIAAYTCLLVITVVQYIGMTHPAP